MNNVPETQNYKPQALDIDDAADAFLTRWEDAEEPSEQSAEEAIPDEEEQADASMEEDDSDDQAEDELDEQDDADEEAEQEDDDEYEAVELDDDTLVDIQVNGKVEQASIKELKRLFGQEASLTQKSQEASSKRKEADEALSKTNVIMQKMIEQAEARYKPYAEVDMLVASRQMDEGDFAQLRKEAKQAHEDLLFLQEEADNFYKDVQAKQQQAMQEAAREAVKVLQADIPEWSNQLYDDIRSYAVSQGLNSEEVDRYVDPSVLKILHKARLYDQAKQITTVKKKRTAKKVLKSKKAPANANQAKQQKMRQAKAKLQARGNDIDDVADLLLTRWEV